MNISPLVQWDMAAAYHEHVAGGQYRVVSVKRGTQNVVTLEQVSTPKVPKS